MRNFLRENILFAALTVAIMATGGSLYFSEVLHFPPCILCWYQRICMYPLVPILLTGILRKDQHVSWYVFPLTITGLGIGIYHNLLYYNILPEAVAPCIAGISCTTKFIEYFGVLTIPLLSLLSFVFIILCMIIYNLVNKQSAQ